MKKVEYNYIVNKYFNESPYARYNTTKLDIVMDFLGDFLRKYAFLIEHNKTYKSKDFSRLIRKYNNGSTYEENEDNIKIKNCVDWSRNQ